MDQAISAIMLCGGIPSAIVGFVAFNRRRHDWRWLGRYFSDAAKHPLLLASSQKPLEEQEREADALMRAHP